MNCKTCRLSDSCWTDANISKEKQEELLCSFFIDCNDFCCLDEKLKLCSLSSERASAIILRYICEYSIDDIIGVIKKIQKLYSINKGSIPQFSDIDVCCFNVIDVLIRSGLKGVSYETMGYMLRSQPRNRIADFKYGENQAKTAASLGLCLIDNNHKIWISPFGVAFYKLSHEQQKSVAVKLLLRIPLIQKYFINDKDYSALLSDISILKESTQKRRLSSINTIIKRIESAIQNEF